MHGDQKCLMNCYQFSGGNLEAPVNVGKSEVVPQHSAIVNFFIEWTWSNERQCLFQCVAGELQISARLVNFRKYAIGEEFRQAEAVAFRIGSNVLFEWNGFLSTADLYEQ